MSEHMLVHLNVVRPIGAFSAAQDNAVYFFSQLPLVFARAKQDGDMFWHNHGARLPDGGYLELPGVMAHSTTATEENFHIMTMAGWRDLAAMQRFTYREPLHAEGIRRLKGWVDRSEGPTLALWWAPRGTRVSLDEAWDKLARLRRDGPSDTVFTPRTARAAPG
ncbi:DUF3291 domain-containing protein [uncultured Tateyamaria sp.]|uniref:DUF3291 domain-containing protein n=1 Tax=uncultured Tateyamaria sp. TaxID=455651 RepID=UPI002625A2C6|nr:DUF3291 domain-containing protein [uncultured Tateyamaria sp.]